MRERGKRECGDKFVVFVELRVVYIKKFHMCSMITTFFS